MRNIIMRLLPLVLGLCLAALAGAADQPLVDFGPGFNLQSISATDSKFSLNSSGAGAALRVDTGRKNAWPGVTLAAPAGGWNLSPYAYVKADIKNTGSNAITVSWRVDNPGADGTKNCLTNNATLKPGEQATLTISLKRFSNDKLDGKLFGMRGYPVKAGGPGCIDPARINQILFFVTRPKAGHQFEISNIRATGAFASPTAWTSDAQPFFPFIDTFGQYKHKDWPGKTHSIVEMHQRRNAEEKELAARPGPQGWDQYGGWAEAPQRKATGFFRTEKVNGKWWLVDPEGRLFFSHGIDCVGEINYTPIDERQAWFEDFPGNQPEFKRLLTSGYALKGHYAGRNPKIISFDQVNLIRKYGADRSRVYPDIVHRRLRSWGINTIANWSTEQFYLKRRTPYTDAIGTRRVRSIEGGEGYWAKFPDVFDPDFARSVRQAMDSKKEKSAGDPWCLGYFSDNEMSWGEDDSHAVAALKSPADQPAKIEFANDLKKKYGEIGKLNQAWGTAYESWDALLQSRTAPDRKKVRPDLITFYTKTAERYFKTMREAIKSVAPNQLYLGCRFAWTNDLAAAAAAKYCDVVSYNIYKRGVDEFKFGGGADVPLIIGEFHLGALDRGMFHTGLVPVASQAERAQAYTDYVASVLRHPQFVGCHWFKYQDESNTGRVLDEENYQIGFIDVADTPYPETIAASRDLADKMYRLRMGAQ